ncbi:MAG: phosphoribosyltransferase family protein [Candidatus Binatus sp.]|uniref:phosphoribosyltransferase family protein n=1 Tax=Candidatus Binatus sp. TaxID=2811406 RepID=UPI0027222C73|nr:phosphoribosyltransferase family protein [Candidatus Binatus sp.]MDO8431012.1 phosphoribosyltransferase family protein [Candidatus Binatus sp.]
MEGELMIPKNAVGVVLFAHGSGSSRLSPRNQFVAEALQKSGIGTLLFDLLTEAEASDRDNVFDIDFLAHRLSDATRWLKGRSEIKGRSLGYFGASTGAAAALVAASQDHSIRAVVSRGGRPDLAIRQLADMKSPVLLIVGGHDYGVIELNEKAYRVLRCEKSLKIVPGATHLFEEPGALEQVAELASDWFKRHLKTQATEEPVTREPTVYSNRQQAGRMLAQRLKPQAGADVVVLGVPRGGLPVAKEVADALGAPLDVVVVRKLGAPGQPELGIGAVVDGDHPRAIFNQDIVEHLGVSDEYIEAEIARQLKEVNRREIAYRGGRAKIPLAGKTVILVDDGIATGSSARAALRGVRRQKPKRLVLAVPVAPTETIEALRSEADEIVCLETPQDFFAVGQFYRDFHQVTDDEVRAILQTEQPAEAHSES